MNAQYSMTVYECTVLYDCVYERTVLYDCVLERTILYDCVFERTILYDWRCEHARFCVEVLYALYSFIHSWLCVRIAMNLHGTIQMRFRLKRPRPWKSGTLILICNYTENSILSLKTKEKGCGCEKGMPDCTGNRFRSRENASLVFRHSLQCENLFGAFFKSRLKMHVRCKNEQTNWAHMGKYLWIIVMFGSHSKCGAGQESVLWITGNMWLYGYPFWISSLVCWFYPVWDWHVNAVWGVSSVFVDPNIHVFL